MRIFKKQNRVYKSYLLSTLLIGLLAFGAESRTIPYTIAYTSNDDGNLEIYLSNIEAKSKIKITEHAGGDGYSAWSPDGKRIAFYAKYDEKKTWSIHTMKSDGSNRKRLTHEFGMWDNSPTWSPDGKKIAFSREYKGANKSWQAEIWIMNSDGSELTKLKSLKGGGPYFTPDNKIVFHSEYEGKKSEISIADADGSNIVHLTNDDSEEWHPEVSPDGKFIAYMSDRESEKPGNYEIYIMNIDGSNQEQLTNNGFSNWYPSWSPDGSKLIYSSITNGVKDIYIINKDGSSAKKIISNGSQAAWLKVQN